jgi:GxxExxY protein
LLVEDKVIVELKAIKEFEEIHTATILAYLRATGKHVGLLINFNKPRLVDGIKRFQR